MDDESIEEISAAAICAGCVGEPYLRAEIERDGEERECRYCGDTAQTLTLAQMADRIEAAFEDHYSRTAQDPDYLQRAMMKDPETDYDWWREGEQTVFAIMNAADIPEEAATDVQRILADRYGDYEAAQMGEETEFDEDAHYEEKMPGDGEWRESWRDFERSIKTEARFFSRVAAEKLGALFDDIGQMLTRGGSSLIVEAGPGTALAHFYRGRVFQSDSKLETALMRPDRELAAPPSYLAAAGRMNARGISTFYGATTPEIALAEVRPPVGSLVAMARFEVIRSMKFLDLNALKDIHVEGSIFDPRYARELGRMMFLRSLCDRMARPVMPDDQDSEYLPTQAVADYLATEGKEPLDGILFPSVQAGGEELNVVLFYKASRCEELDIPHGTDLRASSHGHYGEGPVREYTVFEQVPPEKPTAPEEEASPFDFNPADLRELESGDYRDPALRIEIASLRVHLVKAVKFDTDEHKVSRHRSTKTEDEPF